MSDKPAISIILPLYNARPFLQETINSIKSQTFEDYECLIINDGSRDHPEKILNNIKDGRFKVINHKENRGIARRLNEGLELAQADMIARQDADDFSYPKRLEKQLAFLESHPDHILVGTQAEIINEAGATIRKSDLPCDNETLRARMIIANHIFHGSVMFRKNDCRYNEERSSSQDYELWLELMKYGKMANLSESLYKWREHDNSITAKKYDKGFKHSLEITMNYVKDCFDNGRHHDVFAAWLLPIGNPEKRRLMAVELNKEFAQGKHEREKCYEILRREESHLPHMISNFKTCSRAAGYGKSIQAITAKMFKI